MKPSTLTAVNKELQEHKDSDMWGLNNEASDLDDIQMIEDIPLQERDDDIFNFTRSKVDLPGKA